MITSVFVYGTLKRGESRERLWPYSPTRVTRVWTHGALFSREDYPAMLGGEQRVAGQCWEFAANEMQQVLRELDAIEGTNQPGQADLYRRVTVNLFDFDGHPIRSAYCYWYARDPIADGFRPVLPRSAGDYVGWPETGRW